MDTYYHKSNLKKVCSEVVTLNPIQQKELLKLLNKYKNLFDGSLGYFEYSGGWAATDITESAGTYYVSVAVKPGANELMAAKADGGVDLYECNAGSGNWTVTTDIVSGHYTDIAWDDNDVYLGAVVPEPATLVLLGLGSLAMVLRKKQ